MVQIKDSVLRVSGNPPGLPPHRPGVRISVMPPRRSCLDDCPVSGPGRMSAPHRGFLMPDADSDCQQLVNNLSRELYVVDFRRVVRHSKKVRKFRENGLTFSKVVHGGPKHRNDTVSMLKTRRKRCRGFSRGNPFAPVVCGSLRRSCRTRFRTVPARAAGGIVNKF